MNLGRLYCVERVVEPNSSYLTNVARHFEPLSPIQPMDCGESLNFDEDRPGESLSNLKNLD